MFTENYNGLSCADSARPHLTGNVFIGNGLADINNTGEPGPLVGGSLAAGSHFTKAGSRVLINTSPEPFTNWTASFAEDIAVIGGLWAALSHPWAFLVMLAVFILVVAWTLPKLWRAVKILFQKLGRFFGGGQEEETKGAAGERRKDVLSDLYKDAKDKEA